MRRARFTAALAQTPYKVERRPYARAVPLLSGVIATKARDVPGDRRVTMCGEREGCAMGALAECGLRGRGGWA